MKFLVVIPGLLMACVAFATAKAEDQLPALRGSNEVPGNPNPLPKEDLSKEEDQESPFTGANHVIVVKPAKGVAARIIARYARRKFRKLQTETLGTVVEGTEDAVIDTTLNDQGLEHLGTANMGDLENAYTRFRNNHEQIDIVVQDQLGTHFEHLNLTQGQRVVSVNNRVVVCNRQNVTRYLDPEVAERRVNDGRVVNGPCPQDSSGSRRLDFEGDTSALEGRSMEGQITYTGIYVEECPGQEFWAVCEIDDIQALTSDERFELMSAIAGNGMDEEERIEILNQLAENCEIYSVGEFDPDTCGHDERQLYTSDYTTGLCPGSRTNWECATYLETRRGYTCTRLEDWRGIPRCCSAPDRRGARSCQMLWEDLTCFSASMMALTPLGLKRMDQVQVNDLVLTASGNYQKVYAFHHRNPQKDGSLSSFVQILSESGKKIELTHKHMIYVNGNHYPVEAAHVKVGDYLSLQDEPGVASTQEVVTAIRRVQTSGGGYSPITEDGTIVVNGFVASSHSNPQYAKTEMVQVAGKDLMHRVTLSQFMLSPIRFFCLNISSKLCQVDMDKESYLPFTKTIDNVYHAAVNSGLEKSFMEVAAFSFGILYGLEQLFKVLWFPIFVTATVLAVGWAVAKLRMMRCEVQK